MASTQYAANMARAFMVVELAMASVNCGAPIATRADLEEGIVTGGGVVTHGAPPRQLVSASGVRAQSP